MISHVGDIFREVRGLGWYSATSVAGAFYQPAHHREGSRRPVVLVPGFLGRGLNFAPMRRYLLQGGHPVFCADLGFGVGCIREKAELLEALILEEGLEDFYMVGHSMGGLIQLAMGDEVAARVRHFISLGTAYRGALLSHLIPVSVAARQLNPGSDLVEEIYERARRRGNLTAIIGRWDEIAFPKRALRVEGECEEVEGVAGHVQLITHRESLEQLSGLLERLDRG